MWSLINLDYLDLSENYFDGPVPPSFSSMVNLTHLDLSRNLLNSSIPWELGNLQMLQTLNLSGNLLHGTIPFGNKLPISFTNLTKLKSLDLSHNNFTGIIPSQIGSLKNLVHLDLSGNKFMGLIPPSIGSMVNLTFLDLTKNQLNSSIPRKLGNLQKLEILDLSHNYLVGVIPSDLGKLSCLVRLDLPSNQLSGKVLIQNPCYLTYLNLSMTGIIPIGLTRCLHLKYLDLSSNKLVKRTLDSSNIPHYVFIHMSHNHFTSPRKLQQINKLVICSRISLPITSGFCFVVLVYVCYRRLKATKKESRSEIIGHGDVSLILNYDGTIAYEDFIKATEDFDFKYCIGTGSYGCVYIARLSNGKTFALKKLHLCEAKQSALNKSFKNEVQVLTNLRHKNIVKLYGFCFHNKNNFLVYEYIENGSLFCVLRDITEAIKFDWVKRVEVVKDIANALAYMHHDCFRPVIHHDISSNNILLNSKMEAFVADFGAARFLDPNSSNQTVISGTFGYIAPALVVVLETIGGKHPGDLLSLLNTGNHHGTSLEDMLDARLPYPTDSQIENDILRVYHVALACILTNPKSRPTMRSVCQKLSR